LRYIFNTPVLTSHGVYRFSKITLDEAVAFLREGNWKSSVGHQAAADLLTQLSGVPIPLNRVRNEMEPGDVALVLRLLRRLPEGVSVVDMEELRMTPHEYCLLERIG